jgi:GNAT superfamily N-acetyltransferase
MSTVTSEPTRIRAWRADDDAQALTALLHRAYARLGAMGLNFTAVDQTVDVTLKRIAQGECFVAEREGVVCATITVCKPFEPSTQPWAADAPCFFEPRTAHFHQLAVDPSAQGEQLGDRLVAVAESWALDQGFKHMACDTAMPAAHLRVRYARLGYREVGEVQWRGKTYRSVLLEKVLSS